MIFSAAALAALLFAAPVPARRQIAVTIDDLPSVSVVGEGTLAIEAMTRKLLAAIRASGAPAIGFVNESNLGPEGSPDPARVALLRLWLDAGFELGNHTYSHPDLHQTTLAAFEDDVARGEPVTAELLRQRGRRLRYFRHPFLHTGRDLVTKTGLETFLAGRGYTIAPVTIDNADWIFARAYAVPGTAGDRAAMDPLPTAYIAYMNAKLDYFERQSVSLFGREIPQILLIHASSLNGDTFGRLAGMMRRRGYAFVSLDEALKDEAYRSADSFVGAGGITWLHRWALTRGGPVLVLPGEPAPPDFVMKAARVTSE